ncbi:hypothetical protein DRN63_00190 [Nanoarchaeota archaeon]|nr:MAG: hypothetical protein DRN63_00190 [Nanoarchaeota archaeon]
MIVRSICPYCGCGCSLVFKRGREIEVLNDLEDDVSKGKPCVKGLTCTEPLFVERIKYPMVRRGKKFERISWEKAYEIIRKRLSRYSGEEVAITGSGELTNEDNYLIQKFARLVLKSNNVDTTARLCHAPTLYGMYHSFGITRSLNFIEDMKQCDCFLLVGTNPKSNYPIAFYRMLSAKYEKNAKVISIQNIFNLSSEYADLALCIKPNTEIALFNCVINYLIENNLIDERVKKIENFGSLKKTVSKYSLNYTAKISGLDKDAIKELCELIGSSEKLGVMHGMGFTQHAMGVENVFSLLNLVIIKNAFFLSLRGKVNIQGAGDVGCFPNLGDFWDASILRRIEAHWKTSLPRTRGKTLVESFLIDPVKAYYIIGMNPAQSMPSLDRVHKNLSKMFVIFQHSHTCLTMRFADLVLPSSTLLEESGTIVNGEGRVRLVTQVVKPISKSKPTWRIIKELARVFGFKEAFNYKNEREIFEEIVALLPGFSHLRVEEIYSGVDGFLEKTPKFLKFKPVDFKGFEEIKDEKYNFILTTGRMPYHFCTGESTRRSITLNKFLRNAFFYLNPFDAKELGIEDGDSIEVESRASKLTGPVRIDPRLPRSIILTPFFSEDLHVNKLVTLTFDPKTKTPNYKNIAVRIRKIYKRKRIK